MTSDINLIVDEKLKGLKEIEIEGARLSSIMGSGDDVNKLDEISIQFAKMERVRAELKGMLIILDVLSKEYYIEDKLWKKSTNETDKEIQSAQGKIRKAIG
jgi:hypothetical protein